MRPLRATWRHLTTTVGRRGCSMLFLAVLDLVYGWSIIAAPAETRAQSGYRYITHLLPADAWGTAWIAVGLICLISAFWAQDRAGFACAAALLAGWGLVYVVGWIAHGIPRGYANAAIWLAAGAWVLIISTWPEAPRRPGRNGGTDGR